MKFLTFIVAILVVMFGNTLGKPTQTVYLKNGVTSPKFTFVATVDGKSFFVDKSSRSWNGASTFCKEVGMKLASISSVKQYDALDSSTVPEFENFYGYWTCGRDAQEIGQFRWNDTNAEISGSYLPFEKLWNIDYLTCAVFYKRGASNSAMTYHKCPTLFYTLCETS